MVKYLNYKSCPFLIQGQNLTREDLAKPLNINPKAVIDVEKIKGVKKITNYITKSMWCQD
ncbi:MAG: hypothetical protein ACI87X_001270, partial [Candidatus Arcticimaribacter sp.]